MKDINSALQIVGRRDTDLSQGYLLENGVFTDFGTLPGGTYSEALGISESGKVAGYWGNNVTGNPGLHAFIWFDGVMNDIDVLPGFDHTAQDINNHDEITGWMGVAPFPPFYGEAYRWSNGVTTPLGFPAGGVNSDGLAINDRGDVCGSFMRPNNKGGKGSSAMRRACVWIDGEAIDIGVLPPFVRSLAYDLNEQRQVVGYSYDENLVGHAFIWQNGAIARLNDLIPPDVNVNIKRAVSINNRGQIAANGVDLSDGRQVAVRLTPIPPPPGDCDCNGRIDMDDILGVINQWGPTIPTTTADFNDDGIVSVDDLVEVLRGWGR